MVPKTSTGPTQPSVRFLVSGYEAAGSSCSKQSDVILLNVAVHALEAQDHFPIRGARRSIRSLWRRLRPDTKDYRLRSARKRWPTAIFQTPKGDDWTEILLYILGQDVCVVPRSRMPLETTLDLESPWIYDHRNAWCVFKGIDPTTGRPFT